MSDADSNASELSVKRKMSPSMASPKEISSRNQSGSNMVPGRRSGKGKKQKQDTTQQDDSAEAFKTINKRLQEKSRIFSEKVKKRWRWNFWWHGCFRTERPFLFYSILKVKFKHEMNNLIFKYQMLNLQQNAQPNPPIQSPPSTFQLTTPPSQSNGAVFMQNTNGRSFDCYDTSMSSNQWNS